MRAARTALRAARPPLPATAWLGGFRKWGAGPRALLAGDNSERPYLRYLDTGAAIRIGDRIVTSGQGGVFPPGLPVGVVACLDGGAPRVEPYVELSRVGYLRIVDYGLADALPKPVPIVPRGG